MEEPFIGEVDIYGFNFAPDNWAECDGSVLNISDHQALYSLVRAFYGGDGRTTFALPDLRGRLAVGQGQNPWSEHDWKMGSTNGKETHTLSLDELPKHSHLASYDSTSTAATLSVSTQDAESDKASDGSFLAKAAFPMYRTDKGAGTVSLGGVQSGVIPIGTVFVGDAGGEQAFSLLQSVQALNYCMALVGLYPSRS
uniref:Phage Tail Collar domain protein n=1 Tax=Marinomonas sp. (strain MWYL1) TaxID=400668 RepID=A6VVW5_MARMS